MKEIDIELRLIEIASKYNLSTPTYLKFRTILSLLGYVKKQNILLEGDEPKERLVTGY